MAFNFPNNPSVNDEVTFGTITYVWNGTSWESGSTGLSYAEVANRIDFTSDRANSAFELANNSSLWAVRQSFVATANQSVFNISTGYLPDYVDVFYNGIKLYDGEDYTANNGSSVILTNPAPVNTIIEVLSFGANVSTTNLYVLASATGFSSRQSFTATEGQTTFNPTGGYRVGYIDVFYNGIKLNIPTDVTANNGTDVVFVGLTPTAGDLIETIAITPDVSIANAVPITGGTISGNITIAGNILPSSTNTYYLGSDTQRWHSLFVNSNSIDIDGLVLSNQNGTLAVSSGGAEPTPIAGEDTWVRDHANAAFAAANNVGPQIEPAFAQANAAFEAANNISVFDANTNTTGFFSLPTGNTAQRPANAANGHIRFNTTTGQPEWYDGIGGEWYGFSQGAQYNVEYLIIGGGGAGGGNLSGGGGAGGFLTGTTIVSSRSSYSMSVGAGGASVSTPGQAGNTGANGVGSVAFSLTAVGGGGGGGGFPGTAAASGGSGGGGSGYTSNSGGAGTPGQGNQGGAGAGGAPNYGGGGGGGSGEAGQAAPSSSGKAGRGGNGTVSSISGTPLYWAAGGGGGAYTGGTGGGNGGLGGGGGGGADSGPGGTGGTSALNSGEDGTNGIFGGGDGGTNTGSGGGGANHNNPAYAQGGSGGSGIIILRYTGSQRGTGGTITSNNGYTIHTFTGSGTFTA